MEGTNLFSKYDKLESKWEFIRSLLKLRISAEAYVLPNIFKLVVTHSFYLSRCLHDRSQISDR